MRLVTNPDFHNDASLQQLLRRLPEAFTAGEGELIYDKRNQLRRFVLPSGQIAVVKSYHHPNLFQRLCYSTFWRNKAIKSFLFGQRLLKCGIDTPTPIAAITYYKWGCLVSKYFFVSTEDNRPDCLILRDGNMEHPEPLIDALAHYFIKLHEAGFLHGDANLSNFLYEQQPDGKYRFAVIDTNRSRFLGRPASQQEAYQNLMRLTHVRSLLSALVRSYARQRGWDEKEAEQAVFDLIARRERRKALLHKLLGK